MARHNETGKEGEQMALELLRLKGYEIVAVNWRYKRLEIDLIARAGSTLVFVEVKTRSYAYFGRPEAFIDNKKEKRLARAAAAYMQQSGHDWAIRFDVVAILCHKKKAWEIEHIEDAFFPGLEL